MQNPPPFSFEEPTLGRRPPRWGIYLAVVLVPLVGWLTVEVSQRASYAQLAEQGHDRLTLYGVTLRNELEKARNIPSVLSGDPQVVALLADGPEEGEAGLPPASRDELTGERAVRAQALDLRLQGLNASLGTSALYVLDEHGMTLAASNWDEGEGSFVGRRFDFRPYFLGAMEGHRARYFALGTASNQPGYYIAMPVKAEGRVLGAVVAKSSMEQLERGWAGGAERVFVTDEHGVIFVTNTMDWRFHSLAPLPAETSQAIAASRQYGDAPPPPVDLRRAGGLTRVDGHGYVMVSEPLADSNGWQLHVLMPVKEQRLHARDRGLLAMALALLGLVASISVIHRARLLRRHTRELEQRVAERTALLVDSNLRLQNEVAERRRAEEELVAKQDELVQAAKLAALGQMSAGMAHEINQPLAAIRSYADNAVTLLGLGRGEAVRDNLGEIAGLTERMARITGQLKQFARKSPRREQALPLRTVVESALALLSGRVQAERVEVTWTPAPAPLWVWGEEVRLQQVLVNLLRNGLDAMAGAEARRLIITAAADARTVSLSVRDSGPGITPEVMAHMFDPFFTTKPGGEGLGLGLSISEGIVREMGGRLAAANHPSGGAVFTMILRRAEAL